MSGERLPIIGAIPPGNKVVRPRIETVRIHQVSLIILRPTFTLAS
ncbi:hypothetical protein LMG24076_04324 [Trinickia soli]|nr:hypothetical protein LMG24076_04324 [Trinickia soli]